ncbi:MAG TPA: hypothetical protein VGH76_06450 [Actinomycetospora sp.]|jgi:hypothetical protein|uniref:hypothetical protein n=1 Tax=Actinomycetospora sp. TaxID=1872135 RepID=UPI002F40E734
MIQIAIPTDRRTWLVVGLLVAALAAAVLAAARPAPAPMTAHGSVTIYGLGSFERPGDDCSQPLFAGRTVSVFDDRGRTLGTTRLTGHGTATDRWHSFAGGFADACRYAITVPAVSGASDTYTLALGTEPGQGTPVDRAQLRSVGAEVTYGHS